MTATEPLRSVSKISMAKALLMARHRLGENDAHRRLQREAMTRRTSMEAIAQQIIDRAYIRTVEASVGALKF